jgi:hypothetical protein
VGLGRRLGATLWGLAEAGAAGAAIRQGDDTSLGLVADIARAALELSVTGLAFGIKVNEQAAARQQGQGCEQPRESMGAHG